MSCQANLMTDDSVWGAILTVLEMPFWTAVTLASEGRDEAAIRTLREVVARESFWRDLLPRVADAGLMPADAAQRLLAGLPPVN